MAKLICKSHKTRVMVLPTRTIHRKDGELCSSTFVEINGRVIRARDIQNDKDMYDLRNPHLEWDGEDMVEFPTIHPKLSEG